MNTHKEIIDGLKAGVRPKDIAKELQVPVEAVYEVLEELFVYKELHKDGAQTTYPR